MGGVNMGMYTEIIFGAGLKEETPKDVIDVIQRMVNGDDLIDNLPDHDFFRSERKWLMKSGGSYYFPGILEAKFWFDDISNNWFLHFRTNIKNYDNEIEKFLDWIKPYLGQGVGSRGGGFYAIVTYEESEEPTIYYLD
jgi:hypothetical protein